MKTAHHTCIVLGEGPLPIQCLDILRENHFEVLAFVTRDRDLLKQAEKYPFPFLLSTAQLDETIQADYLFSINNGFILTPAFISKAKVFAVNYHDSPLPRYAGVYATNWALFNKERKHAVTWHVLTEEIDAGDLLEQEQIELSENEPIWSVNMKCFGAALLSFERLVKQIVEGNVRRTPQDLSQRSYFGLMQRPLNLGFLSSGLTTDILNRLQQVTSYGALNDNEFLLPHLLIGKEYYTVTRFRTEPIENPVPGRIVNSGEDSGFCCQDGLVIPELLFDKANQQVPFQEALRKNSLASNDILPAPERGEQAAVLFETFCRKELFWKNELSRMEALSFPFQRTSLSNQHHREKTIKWSLPDNWKSIFPDEDPLLVMTALTMLYTARLTSQASGTFGYRPAGLAKKLSGFNTLFKDELPLNLEINDQETALLNGSNILKSIRSIVRSGTYTIDLPLRSKALQAMASENFSVVFCHETLPESEKSLHSVYIVITSDGLTLSLPDSQAEQTAAQFFSSLQHFVEGFFSNASSLPYSLPLLSAKETNALLDIMHPSFAKPLQLTNVVAAFDEKALSQPDRVAICDGISAYSYQKFREDGLRVASLLKQRGVAPGDIVMLDLPRCYSFFVMQWATMRCRAAFLPLDVSIPDERKIFMFEDASPVLVVTDLPSNLFPEDKQLIFNYIPEIEFVECSNESQPTDLAYLIYTSGSTGVPKGVRISQGALSCFVSGAIPTYDITSADRILQFSNLGFDASIEEVFCALCSGAGLFLRNEDMLDPEALLQFSTEHQLTVWDFPTAFWRQVMLFSAEMEFPASLRAVIIGGEAITNNDFEVWKKHPSSSRRLFNTYGPTETTVVASVFEVTGDYRITSTIPIGKPLPGYKAYITDSHRQLLPPGVPGELLLAGPALADGYLNRIEAEKKAFLHLKTDFIQSRCYATGDVVCCNPEGFIHYIGRSDNQLKIRGFRVEPGEVENRILSLGGIDQCLVLGKPNERNEKILVGFFVPQPSRIGSAEAIRNECAQILPPYMVPEVLMELKEIPMTPNGKVDQKALLNMAANIRKKKTVTKKCSISNPTAEKLVVLWREVLEDETLCLDDDFFERGGHSLRAVQLMALIRKELNIHLPLSALISYPTPHTLSDLILSQETEHLWNCLVPIRTGGSKKPLYLIHGAGLNVLLYQSLGNHLDPDRPIYALQAKGLDGKTEISSSIEEMASDYIGEIKRIQPEGPYFVFGFSMGGFIAFEMGRQFKERGDEVAFLGVIDTVTNFAREDLPKGERFLHRIQALVGKPLFFFVALFRENAKERRAFVNQKIKNIHNRVIYLTTRLGLYHLPQKVNTEKKEEPIYLSSKVAVAIESALGKYVLRSSPLRVDLFRAEKQMFYIEEPKTYGWSRYAKLGVRVHSIPGEHSKLFAPPNDALFAEVLTRCLNQADETNPGI